MTATIKQQAFRGEILHFIDDPARVGDEKSYEYFEDGLLIVEDGCVSALGERADLLARLNPDTELIHYQDGLIMPGFIDTHAHYPQTEMIASFGEQLLTWLTSYAFPAENRFSDFNYALGMAEFFLQQLLSNGTTTALVFGTVHSASVTAFFEAAKAKNLRMICGKVLMDRNAPKYLLDTPESGFNDSQHLINKWHGKGRLQYAITPRFAPTSSSDQLTKAGELLSLYPSVYMHTHLSEHLDELAWVKALFPDSKNYLDVYQQFGLLGRRSIFAHSIHLSEGEAQLLASSQSSAAFCPTSNLFMGSGLFDFKQAEKFSFELGLGTDVGGGTSFSLLQTMNEAYKVLQLQGDVLRPLKAFYLATLGGARVLDMESTIGNLLPGKEADFIVLDYKATPLIEMRMQHCKDLSEKLFVLSMLGDDRAVRATHILGNLVR